MLRKRPQQAKSASRGFTILEVMVAVAILGLGLTAILSAQFSAVAGVVQARNISLAIGLARCKMSEVEEQLVRDGFPELDETASGPCCEDDDSAITCEWQVSKPVFPDPELGKLDLDTDMDSLGALGNLMKGPADGSKTGGGNPPAGGISQITDALGGGDVAELAAGGVGGLAAMVMSMVYPDLKALFEASTRRVSVIVSWREGSRVRDFEILQWITHPQPPPPETDEDSEDSSSAATSGGSSSGAGR